MVVVLNHTVVIGSVSGEGQWRIVVNGLGRRWWSLENDMID